MSNHSKHNQEISIIMTSLKPLFFAVPFLHLVSANSVAAQETISTVSSSSSWEFEWRLYGWLPDISSKTITGQDIDISLSDILDTLDFTFQTGITAQKGPWSLYGDIIYLGLSEGLAVPVGPTIPATPDIELESWIVTGAVGYDVVSTDSYSLTPFIGVRYLDMTADLNLSGPLGGSVRVVGVSGSNWDGIVGARGRVEINDRWTFRYLGDIGTGDSDFTWQAAAIFDYRFNDSWTGSFGYRHMDYDFDQPLAAQTELTSSGPIFGVRYQF